jgi:homoserine acetyltransferase
MPRIAAWSAVVGLLLPATTAYTQSAVLQSATLDSCATLLGTPIRDCRISYRTLGHLNADRSNAVLIPTWFTGTTADIVTLGPAAMADTTRFFVVLVDALGDGVSSSPSNSTRQPRAAFPPIGIGDMVGAEYRLMTEVLGVRHLAAVVGISMGGMQSLEWAARHPRFIDRAVVIAGTPRPTSADILLWTALRHTIEEAAAFDHGNYIRRPTIPAAIEALMLAIYTPSYRGTATPRDSLTSWLAATDADTSFDWNDWRLQLNALIGFDLGDAARSIRVPMLIVTPMQDRMVDPVPALRLARTIGARTLVLRGSCGHMAFQCEYPAVAAAVRTFLSSPTPRTPGTALR